MKFAARSDAGKVRMINQDAIFAANNREAGIFLVADGMGGHSHGEKASQLIAGKMEEWWSCFLPENYNNDFMRMIIGLKQAVQQANRQIFEEYNKRDICGSTIALLFIYKRFYGILFAGDSRIYAYHKWTFRQITTDEVWENQPGLLPFEKQEHWDRCHGRLYNAVGIRKEMQCRIVTDIWKPGMVFLICSDGLYKYCSKPLLKKYLKQASRKKIPHICADALWNSVCETEAGDNISMILVTE